MLRTNLSILALVVSSLAQAMTGALQGPSALDGSKIRITPGKAGTVVVFVSPSCPCSNSHVPEIKALHEEFKGFNFYGVHAGGDDDPSTAQQYFQDTKLPFPVIADIRSELANQFKALRTPHAFVMDPKNQLVYQGGVSDSSEFNRSKHRYLREALADIAAERTVRTARSRPLGCTISRKGR